MATMGIARFSSINKYVSMALLVNWVYYMYYVVDTYAHNMCTYSIYITHIHTHTQYKAIRNRKC